MADAVEVEDSFEMDEGVPVDYAGPEETAVNGNSNGSFAEESELNLKAGGHLFGEAISPEGKHGASPEHQSSEDSPLKAEVAAGIHKETDVGKVRHIDIILMLLCSV